jgi:hypothetical protein
MRGDAVRVAAGHAVQVAKSEPGNQFGWALRIVRRLAGNECLTRPTSRSRNAT